MRYLSLLCLLAGSCIAADSSLKEEAKELGQKTVAVARQVGEAGKEAGKKVAETAVEVGHATRDGAKKVATTVKSGVNNVGKSSAAASSASSDK